MEDIGSNECLEEDILGLVRGHSYYSPGDAEENDEYAQDGR